MIGRGWGTAVMLAVVVATAHGWGRPCAVSAQRSPVRSGAAAARDAAAHDTAMRILVSIARRRLWVVQGERDTLLVAPVAVGSGRTLTSRGHTWVFNTPRGIRVVESKEVDPIWVRPDWSFVESARRHGLRLESLDPARPRAIGRGRRLVLRDSAAGVIDTDGTFAPLPADEEIIFGDVLYMPPLWSVNRHVAGDLGHYRLNLGEAIGLHGTLDSTSIGHAVTHGCLRLADDPLAWVYDNVPVGARVYIF